MVQEVEAWLELHRPSQWRSLTAGELERKPFKSYKSGWRIEVGTGSLAANATHLVLVLDRWFPNSQPVIFAPEVEGNYRWPHVETEGKLCLPPTLGTATLAARLADLISSAEELLNYTEGQKRAEFEREFVTYWTHRANNPSAATQMISLVAPDGLTRELVYYREGGRYVLAEDKDTLQRWLRNTGRNPGTKDIFPTWMLHLNRPWIPSEFPELGRHVTEMMTAPMLERCMRAGHPLPLIIEADTVPGAFVGAVLRGAKEKDLAKGFRSIARVPPERVVASFASQFVERCSVTRMDGAWIHGRDHPSTFESVKGLKVAIVGCGAIGSAFARLLAQAGVGELLLVDKDILSSANISRHILGAKSVGGFKASSLRDGLRRDFPHLKFESFDQRFEELNRLERERLQLAHLVVAAGIDIDGEAALDAWRIGLPQPPVYISCWTEAFAVAGHAVALFGHDSIISQFDEQERPRFRLTDWPNDAGNLIAEAGCGNVFQPYGVVDLNATIGLAASLAMEVLMEKVPNSCRRVWMGDRSTVTPRGGTLREAFTDSYTVKELPW